MFPLGEKSCFSLYAILVYEKDSCLNNAYANVDVYTNDWLMQWEILFFLFLETCLSYLLSILKSRFVLDQLGSRILVSFFKCRGLL